MATPHTRLCPVDPWAGVESSQEIREWVAKVLDRPHVWRQAARVLRGPQPLPREGYLAPSDTGWMTWRECQRCGSTECPLADIDAPTASEQARVEVDR